MLIAANNLMLKYSKIHVFGVGEALGVVSRFLWRLPGLCRWDLVPVALCRSGNCPRPPQLMSIAKIRHGTHALNLGSLRCAIVCICARNHKHFILFIAPWEFIAAGERQKLWKCRVSIIVGPLKMFRTTGCYVMKRIYFKSRKLKGALLCTFYRALLFYYNVIYSFR